MTADFLQLADKTILVCGVANKKSVAWHTARVLQDSGANVVYAVRSAERKAQLESLVPESDVFVCDVERQDEIDRALARQFGYPMLRQSRGKRLPEGLVTAIDGNKLDVEFEKAGPKKVLDSFVQAA